MTNNEEQKSVIDKMLSKIGLTTIKLEAEKVALEKMKLDDGTTVIEADVFEAGNPVMIVTEDEQMIPLPVGVYGLEDGRELEVQEEGVIFEVREVAAEEEAPVEEAPVAASEKPAVMPVAKKVVESVSKESYFSKQEVEEMISKAIEAKLSEIIKVEEVVEEVELSAKPIVQNPERISFTSRMNEKGGLTSFLNNIK
tara:strand:- start:1523 stop:2113 length:591 start_codon:yes stop_codon:yes gene_type:complete